MAWAFLLAAILTEVFGMSLLNASADAGSPVGIVITIALICFSYVLLSFAVRSIAIGVAFAVWEGLGLSLVTVVGVLVFNESLSVPAALGIAGVLIGIFLLEGGVHEVPETGGDES